MAESLITQDSLRRNDGTARDDTALCGGSQSHGIWRLDSCSSVVPVTDLQNVLPPVLKHATICLQRHEYGE